MKNNQFFLILFSGAAIQCFVSSFLSKIKKVQLSPSQQLIAGILWLILVGVIYLLG